MSTDEKVKDRPQSDVTRRDMLKGAIAGAAAVGISTVGPTSALAELGSDQPKNPYGGGPGTGLQFPAYYKPTASVRTRMNYFPGSEPLGADEMRISFVGSCPFPPGATRPAHASWSNWATATGSFSTSAPAV